MAMRLFQAKKGESLIEVVVSLGILAFVFTGALSLIVVTINLNLSSRQRTEAITMAQRNMNDYIVNGFSAFLNDSGSCILNPPLDSASFEAGKDVCLGNGAGLPGKTNEELTSNSCQYFVARALDSNGYTGEVNGNVMLNDANFIAIESHVVWYTRGLGKQDYFVTKLVRKQ